MDIEDLLKRQEGKTLEFKRDLSSPDGVVRAIVAFANTSGGVLLVGVEDPTRRVVGVSDPLGAEERLASLVADRIRPPLVPDIEVHPWRGTHLLGVEIYPSPVRPHYIASMGPNEGTYVRVGSTNRRADQALRDELARHARNESFDEQPMPELDSEAIDISAASELFAESRALRSEDLRTLRIVAEHQGRMVPTVGGLVLFGKRRLAHFPDAWIQAGRFSGADRRKIADSADIQSYPVIAIEEALAFVRRHTAREIVIEGLRRGESWAFPIVAVREALVNAVVHTDYGQHGAPIRLAIFDNRLEIENPGLLPFGLTVEDLRKGVSKLRNRVIGRVFGELGLVEQWGSGIQRMTAACQTAGLAPPGLEEVGTHFRVTISSAKEKPPDLDTLDRAILTLIRGSDGLSTREVAEGIHRSTRATRTRLSKLVDQGQIVEVGTGPKDPKRRYHLASE